MPISTITAIKPNGSFPSAHGDASGLMYKFIVSFADGASGEVNAKSPTPYYKVGEQIAYQVTGEFQGISKFKISKLNSPMPQPAGGPDPAKFVPQEAFRPNVQPITGVNGPTAGMATGRSLEILTQGMIHEEIVKHVCNPSFWQGVYEVASDIVRVMQKIESGDLAKPVSQRGTVRPKAGPGGAVALDHNPELDEDHPF